MVDFERTKILYESYGKRTAEEPGQTLEINKMIIVGYGQEHKPRMKESIKKKIINLKHKIPFSPDDPEPSGVPKFFSTSSAPPNHPRLQ